GFICYKAGKTPTHPELLSLPPGRYPPIVGFPTLAPSSGECSSHYAEPAETEAEDSRSVGGVVGRRGKEGRCMLRLGRPPLGRPIPTGSVKSDRGPSTNRAAVRAADVSA